MKKMPLNENKIRELYENDNSIIKISSMFGCSFTPIKERLQKMGITIKTPFRRDLNNLKIKALYESGMGCRKIAQEFKTTRATILLRLKKMGITITRQMPKMEAHPNWKGGRQINDKGYVLIKIRDSNGHGRDGYILEHIYIWEKTHNRKLPKDWVIHHLNGIKNDNRPENLIAMDRGKHHQLAEPYKKRIRELEIEIKRIKQLNLF